MFLRYEVSRIQPDITLVEFRGKIVSGEQIQKVETEVQNLLSLRERKFVFDLTGVDFVDSTGMGTIAHCFSIITRSDGGLRIAASARVKQLFQTTRLDTIITFCPTVAVACQNFVLGSGATAC